MNILRDKIELVRGIANGSEAFTGPSTLDIDLTDKCESGCLACWTHSPYLEKTPIKHELSINILKPLLFDLKELGVKKICFAGRGEPFFHPYFLEILDECSRLNLKVLITTNGDCLNHDFVKNLSNYSIEEIKISLWSLDSVNLKALCPGRSMNNVHNALELAKIITNYNRKIVRFNCIVAKNNIREIDNFISKAHECRMTFIKFEPVRPSNGNIFMVLGVQEKLYIMTRLTGYKMLLRKYGIGSNIEEFVKKLLLDKDNKGNYNFPRGNIISCFHGWVAARILASGDVVFCCECVEHPIGNIKEKRFKEIWFSEEYCLFRQNALKYGCIDWGKGKINCSYNQKNKMINRALSILKYLGYWKN